MLSVMSKAHATDCNGVLCIESYLLKSRNACEVKNDDYGICEEGG